MSVYSEGYWDDVVSRKRALRTSTSVLLWQSYGMGHDGGAADCQSGETYRPHVPTSSPKLPLPAAFGSPIHMTLRDMRTRLLRLLRNME